MQAQQKLNSFKKRRTTEKSAAKCRFFSSFTRSAREQRIEHHDLRFRFLSETSFVNSEFYTNLKRPE